MVRQVEHFFIPETLFLSKQTSILWAFQSDCKSKLEKQNPIKPFFVGITSIRSVVKNQHQLILNHPFVHVRIAQDICFKIFTAGNRIKNLVLSVWQHMVMPKDDFSSIFKIWTLGFELQIMFSRLGPQYYLRFETAIMFPG